ncbi:MAG: hypothetical protein WA924_14550, partial [Burkholderiaceae bacterium]
MSTGFMRDGGKDSEERKASGNARKGTRVAPLWRESRIIAQNALSPLAPSAQQRGGGEGQRRQQRRPAEPE